MELGRGRLPHPDLLPALGTEPASLARHCHTLARPVTLGVTGWSPPVLWEPCDTSTVQVSETATNTSGSHRLGDDVASERTHVAGKGRPNR